MKTKDFHIAVIVRTFSRIKDAEALIHLIKERWTECRYTIFTAHNGENSGYPATDFILQNSHYVPVENNEGHFFGARSLVRAGYKSAKELGGFTHYLFIESDFWLLDDALVHRLLSSMQKEGRSVATTVWVEGRRSLAVDFFLVEASYMHSHPEILDWDSHIERYVGDLLPKHDVHIIRELRCTHLPGILRMLPLHVRLIEQNRFRIFPKAPAVTHHWESLGASQEEGIAVKKGISNALVGEKIFKDCEILPLPRGLFLQRWSLYVPQSWWFRGWWRKYLLNRKKSR